MGHFVVQPFARLALYATLASCALACGCGADGGRGPPTGPIGPIITEGGSSNGGGSAGGASGGATANGTSGSPFNAADLESSGAFGTGGNGSAGGN